MPAKSKPNEIFIERIYDAPVKTVWEAWTDPAQAAKWWGPRGFTLTTHSKELKPGGIWHYTMHGPDGVDYPNKAFYHEVEKHSRLVYDHGGYDDRPPLFRVTVVFTELKGKTKMQMTMALATPEAAEQTKKFIKQAGGNSTWDRLAEYLAKEIDHKENFVINRTFDASIETLFEMWVDPKKLLKWMGPTGSSMEFIRADIRPGGTSFYRMDNTDTPTMYGRITYKVIDRPHRIVYAQQFCDENEVIARHPMVNTWPETMMTTVTFNEEAPQQTRVTVTWEVATDTPPGDVATFVAARGGMTQGWTGSFDRLDEALAQSKV